MGQLMSNTDLHDFPAQNGRLNMKHRRLRESLSRAWLTQLVALAANCLVGAAQRRKRDPRMCPSPGSRFRPWSAQSGCQLHARSKAIPRVPIWSTCSTATGRLGEQGSRRASSGNRDPARGHRWIATFRRGSFLLSLLIAGGMQPRLCRLERHRLLAREAELSAVPPHPVKYHADAPGQCKRSRASCPGAS